MNSHTPAKRRPAAPWTPTIQRPEQDPAQCGLPVRVGQEIQALPRRATCSLIVALCGQFLRALFRLNVRRLAGLNRLSPEGKTGLGGPVESDPGGDRQAMHRLRPQHSAAPEMEEIEISPAGCNMRTDFHHLRAVTARIHRARRMSLAAGLCPDRGYPGHGTLSPRLHTF
jgi:hypothetical protein